jgi:hypothetical protein
VGAVDVEDGTGGLLVGEGLHCHGEDNGVRGRAAALEGPVEVGVASRVGGHVLAVDRDGFEGEHVVGGWGAALVSK